MDINDIQKSVNRVVDFILHFSDRQTSILYAWLVGWCAMTNELCTRSWDVTQIATALNEATADNSSAHRLDVHQDKEKEVEEGLGGGGV